jgi:hypothetical protein
MLLYRPRQVQFNKSVFGLCSHCDSGVISKINIARMLTSDGANRR